jgi:hypothetical protein
MFGDIMSLEKTLIEWCDEKLKPGMTWESGEPHNTLSSTVDDETLERGILKYQDCTGCIGFHHGYDVYQLLDGSYRIYSPDGTNKNVTFKNCDNIKQVLMHLAFDTFYSNISASEACHLLLHTQIGMNESKLYKEHLKSNKTNKGYINDLIMRNLNLDKNKCAKHAGYYVPDLTKCDDTDLKLIDVIKNDMEQAQ